MKTKTLDGCGDDQLTKKTQNPTNNDELSKKNSEKQESRELTIQRKPDEEKKTTNKRKREEDKKEDKKENEKENEKANVTTVKSEPNSNYINLNKLFNQTKQIPTEPTHDGKVYEQTIEIYMEGYELDKKLLEKIEQELIIRSQGVKDDSLQKELQELTALKKQLEESLAKISNDITRKLKEGQEIILSKDDILKNPQGAAFIGAFTRQIINNSNSAPKKDTMPDHKTIYNRK